MAQLFKSACVLICLMLVVGSIAATTMVRLPQRRNEFMNTEDAVRYLQQLDDFYSNAARPRFGKRVPSLKYLKDLSQEQADLDDYQGKYQGQT